MGLKRLTKYTRGIHLAAVYSVLYTGNFKHQYGTPSGSYHNWAQLTLKRSVRETLIVNVVILETSYSTYKP